MINAKELRIGNWLTLLVKNENLGEVKTRLNFQIKNGIHLDKIVNTTNQEDFIEKILLTTDLLIKCGFAVYGKLDNDYTTHGNGGNSSSFFLQIDWRYRELGYYPMIKSEEFEIIGERIKYVHQLQNLYYSLTQEELECAI